MRRLFSLNDKLVNAILIGTIFLISFTLITLFKVYGEITKQKNIKISEHYDEMSETECLRLQIQCYRENIGLSEEETLEKCKEINFCL